MSRRKIEPMLKLRNQVAIMLSDVELDKLNRAGDITAQDLGYHYPRARFIKEVIMDEVARTLEQHAEKTLPGIEMKHPEAVKDLRHAPSLPEPQVKPKRKRKPKPLKVSPPKKRTPPKKSK